MPDVLKAVVPPEGGMFEVNRTTDGAIVVTGGYERGLLSMLLQGMKMNYTLHVPEDGEWGTMYENGSWSGMIGMIRRQEMDFAVGSMVITEERMKAVSFSYPYIIQELTFATRLPSLLQRYNAFTLPFDSNVWFTLFATMAVLSFVMRPLLGNNSCPVRVLFLVVAAFFRQSIRVGEVPHRNKLYLATWLVCAMLLSTMYGSVLLAFLTVPLREKGIENTKQLAKAVKDGSYTCSTMRGSTYAKILTLSEDPNVNVLGEYIMRNNLYIEPTRKMCWEYLQSGNTALIWSQNTFKMMFQGNLHVSKDVFFSIPIALAVRKDFPRMNRLNKVVKRIVESGIYDKDLGDNSFKNKLKVVLAEDDDRSGGPKQIELEDFQGAFFMLLGGYLMALLTLVFEIIWKALKIF